MKQAQQNMTSYKVVGGDTATGIAKKYGLTPEQFLAANPSFKATGGPRDAQGLTGNIKPGQTYNIPGQDTQNQEPDMTSTKTNPASDGYVPMWNANGERIDIPVGTQAPEGYSASPPAPKPVAVNKAFTPQGNYIAKLSDGTYAQFTALGEQIGQADAAMFDNTQKSQNLLSKMNDMALGNNPLNQDQRNQISGLQQQFQELISQTQNEYANRAGVENIRQNLYGMGQTSIGVGEVLDVDEELPVVAPGRSFPVFGLYGPAANAPGKSAPVFGLNTATPPPATGEPYLGTGRLPPVGVGDVAGAFGAVVVGIL